LRSDVFDRLAEGPEAGVLADFARYCSSEGLDEILSELVANAAAFLAPLPEAEIIAWFGLSPDDDRASILQGAMASGLKEAALGLCEYLSHGTPAIKRDSAALAAVLCKAPFEESEL